MKRNKKSDPGASSWPWWHWTLLVLTAIALFLSALMSWHFLSGGSMVGCGGGSPCEQVLNSRWATIGGIIPVSGLAMGVYLAILCACLFIGRSIEEPIRFQAWSALLVLAVAVAGSALWFTVIQKWIIGNFCPYCMSLHITGLLLASLIIWRVIVGNVSEAKIFSFRQAMVRVGAGLVLAGTLACSQVIFTPAAIFNSGESQNDLPSVDYKDVPIIGSPEAPFIVTVLFDYECTHCQKIHFMLKEAVKKYNGKLAFVLCPTPLNTSCNPYIPRDVDAFKNSCDLARTGLAVWIAKREAFPEFENWMFSFESGSSWEPRSLEKARAKAIELVGQKRFSSVLDSSWIGQYIQTCTHLYGKTIQNGVGGVPKLIFGSHWVIPEVNTTDDLIGVLQKSLALPKP